MQNKFGLKDFILLVLVLIIGVSLWLSMVQNDRKWVELQRAMNRMEEINSQLVNIDRRLERGVAMAAPSGGTASAGGPTSSNFKDESWARPGAPIQWFQNFAHAHSAQAQPGFREGGEFTEIFEAQMNKITAILGEDSYSRRVMDVVCDTLAEYNRETLKLQGTLADAWQLDPKGLWLRVRLREGVRFSDGKPVTAEDVRYTFHDFIMNPQLETESLRSIMRRIAKVEPISERVVEFTFTEADAFNLQNAVGFYILPKHFYSQFTPSQINQSTGLLMGSGPMKLRDLDPQNQWTPGTDIVLVRNDQYWGPRPALAGMRFKSITDELARLTAYRNGEGDMILPTAPQFVKITSEEKDWDKSNHSLKWTNMRSGYSFIAWQCGERNGKLTPFHDRRVRLAMTHLLDRKAMIRDIWAGIGELGIADRSYGPTAPPGVEPWPYDPEKGKALLAEAGWKDRNGDGILEDEKGQEFTFEFTRSSGGQIAERIGKFVVDQYARAGIRVTQRAVDWSQFDQILKTRDFDALTMAWSASAPESDPTQIWSSASIENQGHNFIQWRHPEQDKLINAIRAELDAEKRIVLFQQFNRLLHEEQPYTFVRVPPWLRFVKKDFGNVRAYPAGIDPVEFFQVRPERGM